MLLPLDGPAIQDEKTVTTTETEVKVGASVYSERKAVTIQPVDGTIRVSFETGKPGFYLYQGGVYTFEASQTQLLYWKSVTGSVTVVLAERA